MISCNHACACITVFRMPPATATAIGTRTRELRLAQQLTQEELAARAGVVVRTIASIEAGNSPHRTTRRAIAEALGVTVADLEQAS